jgi:hypothetical protein
MSCASTTTTRPSLNSRAPLISANAFGDVASDAANDTVATVCASVGEGRLVATIAVTTAALHRIAIASLTLG